MTSGSEWDFREFSAPPPPESGPAAPGLASSGGTEWGAGDGFAAPGAAQDFFSGTDPFGATDREQASPFAAPGQAPGADPFGASDPFGTAGSAQAGEAATPLQTVRTPLAWLFAAAALALLAGVVASIAGSLPPVAIACWAAAGPVAILLLAVYLSRDTKARTHVNYSPPLWAPTFYGVALALVFIAVMIASLHIAFWIGRM